MDPDDGGSPAARRRAFPICLAWALSDEWHQTFVPGRSGRLRDVAIDMVGSWVVLGGWRPMPFLRGTRGARPAGRV